jgi:hypothetical protein
MMNGRGQVVQRFTFRSDCEEAIQEILQSRGLFCNNAELNDVRYGAIHRFTFRSDCAEARASVARVGRFCDGGDLFDAAGNLIRRFTFSSDCRRALGI